MSRRSLLDYFQDDESFDESEPVALSGGISRLEARLRELEDRLSREATPVEAPTDDAGFAGQIEAILRRRDRILPKQLPFAVENRASEIRQNEAPVDSAPSVGERRTDIAAPSLVPDLPGMTAIPPDDVKKFAEAVQLLGLAAGKLLSAPVVQPFAPVSERKSAPSDLDAVMQDMLQAFRQIAGELATTVSDLRRLPSLTEERHSPPLREKSYLRREDTELFRIQDEMDELRERLGQVIQRRTRNYG
jgi:hypothetical protein